jgi:hypothetical protein
MHPELIGPIWAFKKGVQIQATNEGWQIQHIVERIFWCAALAKRAWILAVSEESRSGLFDLRMAGNKY